MITLEQIQEEFPIGTKFKCAHDTGTNIITSYGTLEIEGSEGLEDVTVKLIDKDGDLMYYWLYNDGIKAEIISKPELYQIFN